MGRVNGIYISDNFVPVKWFEIANDVQNGKLFVFRVSSLVLCFYLTIERELKGYKFTEEQLSRMLGGTKIHYSQEKYASQGYVTENEKRFWIKHKTLPYVISGRLDTIFTDFHGMFINDYKSSELGAFWYRLKAGCSPDHIMQISIYAFLFYLTNGFEMLYGTITYASRYNNIQIEKTKTKGELLPYHKRVDHERTKLTLECRLFPLEVVEKFLISHPLILMKTMNEPIESFETELYDFAKEHTFWCTDCPVTECTYNGGKYKFEENK